MWVRGRARPKARDPVGGRVGERVGGVGGRVGEKVVVVSGMGARPGRPGLGVRGGREGGRGEAWPVLWPKKGGNR